MQDESRMIELKSFSGLHLIRANFLDYKNLSGCIREPVDIFFHLAWAGVWGADYFDYESQLQNVMAACDSLYSAMKIKCKCFLLVGSSHQYQYIKSNGRKTLYRTSLYGIAKDCAVTMCMTMAQKYGVHIKVALFSNVFGVGDYSSRSTNTLIRYFLDGISPKLISGNEDYDCIYVDDAVQGLMTVAKFGYPDKLYYIGNRTLRSFQEVITEMKDILNPQLKLSFGEISEQSYTDYQQIDLEALYRDTGFEVSCDFSECIRNTAKWVQEQDLPRKEAT